MKGIVIKLPLGKRDSVIKAWIDLTVRQGGNLSRSVDYAITYFAKTGEYLHLGNVTAIPEDKKTPPKNIYFAQNSPAVTWLAERKMNGEKEATAIKRIIRRCLTQDDDGIDSITSIDDLYDLVQGAGVLKKQEPQEFHQTKEDNIYPVQKVPEEKVEKIVKEKPKTGAREEERTGSDDLTASILKNLIPDGLGLGN